MKKIMIFALLSLSFAFLAAASFDEDIAELAKLGKSQEVKGKNYWVFANDYFEFEDEAWERLAESSLIFLAGKAGWKQSQITAHQKIIQESEGIATFGFDWFFGDDIMYSIDIQSILEEFDNPDFKALDSKKQLNELYEYIEENGGAWYY